MLWSSHRECLKVVSRSSHLMFPCAVPLWASQYTHSLFTTVHSVEFRFYNNQQKAKASAKIAYVPDGVGQEKEGLSGMEGTGDPIMVRCMNLGVIRSIAESSGHEMYVIPL